MKMLWWSLPITIALTCMAAHGANLYVSPDGAHQAPFATWEDAATSIQAAVDAAPDGAAIVVRKGVYRGEGADRVVAITQSLTLRSETDKPEDVIIDGEGMRRGILVTLKEEKATVTIAGVTVRNGFVNRGTRRGAGIFLDHSALDTGTAQVRHCIIASNSIAVPEGYNYGGGLASVGKAGSAFHTIVTDCAISGNRVTGRRSYGGGAAFLNTRLTLEDCKVENNRAEGAPEKNQNSHGGGMAISQASEGSAIRNVTFLGNFAKTSGGGGGGALDVHGAEDLLVEDCRFERNASGYGAGLLQTDGTMALERCLFADNTVGEAVRLGWARSSPTTRLVNCTVAGGFFVGSEATLEATDSMKDPTVFLGEDGTIQPVRTVGDCLRRRAQTLRRIEQLAGPLPDRTQLPDPELKVLRDDVLDGKLRRQLIEYYTDSKEAPRVKTWLFSPTPASSLDADKATENTLAAVLCLHQTNRSIGKNEPAGLAGDPNMHYALELARCGFVTLAPDFTGSGEHAGLSTFPNNYVSATMKGVADHMRAVDILSALPAVDPERIGCIGHSLGGFNTMFVAAFDPRIKATVCSCGYTGWQAYADRQGSLYLMGGPNYMPLINRKYAQRADLVPFDWHEIVAALAPRPLFVNAPLRDDPFLVDGVNETLAAAKPIYALYGAPDVVESEHPDAGHSFQPEVREKAYQFLDRHLARK